MTVIEKRIHEIEEFQEDFINAKNKQNTLEKKKELIENSFKLSKELIEIIYVANKEQAEILLPLLNTLKNKISKVSLLNIDTDDVINHGLAIQNIINSIAILQSIKSGKEISNDIYSKFTFELKIKSFATFPSNWDTYGAVKIPKITIKNALNFIKTNCNYSEYICFVYAYHNGDIGIDYKNNKIRIQFRITRENVFYFTSKTIKSNKEDIYKATSTPIKILNTLKK